jgi:hypothetical protein
MYNVVINFKACMITQNYWVFGNFSSPCILETRKQDVSETGSVSVLRWGRKTPTQLSPLERTNLNHFLEYRKMKKSKNPVIMSVIHHRQNLLESTCMITPAKICSVPKECLPAT